MNRQCSHFRLDSSVRCYRRFPPVRPTHKRFLNCSLQLQHQQAIVFVPDDRVTFAGAGFKFLPVKYMNMTAHVVNDSGILKPSGGDRYAFAPHAISTTAWLGVVLPPINTAIPTAPHLPAIPISAVEPLSVV